MLVFLLSLVWDERRVMFQLSGFYCVVVARCGRRQLVSRLYSGRASEYGKIGVVSVGSMQYGMIHKGSPNARKAFKEGLIVHTGLGEKCAGHEAGA